MSRKRSPGRHDSGDQRKETPSKVQRGPPIQQLLGTLRLLHRIMIIVVSFDFHRWLILKGREAISLVSPIV